MVYGVVSGARSRCGREAAQVRVWSGRGVCQSGQRGVEGRPVEAHSLDRVVGREVPRDHERPVARLHREQLAGRALERRVRAPRPATAATVRSSAERAAKASSATGGASQVVKSLPCPHVDALSSRATRLHQLDPLGHRHQPHALRLGLVEHRAQPGLSLVPPVAEQLGVERAAEQAAVLEPRGRAAHEVARVLACERQRGLVVVGLPRVAPGLEVVDGAAASSSR